MTPKFTTPCYVRIENANKRKEVCAQLERIGYGLGRAYADALDTVIVTYPMVANTFCTGSNGQFDETDLKGCIDCGTNTELFLALASMRSDTDEGQWFVSIEPNGMRRQFWDSIPSNRWRKATTQEVIEYFKN